MRCRRGGRRHAQALLKCGDACLQRLDALMVGGLISGLRQGCQGRREGQSAA
jgi:hypothetical protein